MKKQLIIFVFALGTVLWSACQKSDSVTPTINAITYSNLPADPPSDGYNPTNGAAIGVTNKFTFFSFATGAIVANTDSATTKWDLGFRGTSIIVNGGASGPGSTSAQIVTGIFNNLTTAPTSGYNQDTNTTGNISYAIPRRSGNGWYNYDPTSNLVTPIAGRVIIVKTGSGNYAKMEIISYYKNNVVPTVPTLVPNDRYYTFRYVYQPNGTTKLQ
ncbi:MAG: HmuY family protein [Bacteroidetes bacterium]|nr:HmuY family protein [Bacteroidota bacterium]